LLARQTALHPVCGVRGNCGRATASGHVEFWNTVSDGNDQLSCQGECKKRNEHGLARFILLDVTAKDLALFLTQAQQCPERRFTGSLFRRQADHRRGRASLMAGPIAPLPFQLSPLFLLPTETAWLMLVRYH
jgi:hypothetical protein